MIEPVTGSAEEIAAALRRYQEQGTAHLQICLEPTTCESIEGFGEVLERLN